MAYYTVAHLFQGDYDMYGTKFGSVEPSKLTDAVWDAIFLGWRNQANRSSRETSWIKHRRVHHWYPPDLSFGKDLIQNHLTFSMYSHTAIWPEGSENRRRKHFDATALVIERR